MMTTPEVAAAKRHLKEVRGLRETARTIEAAEDRLRTASLAAVVAARRSLATADDGGDLEAIEVATDALRDAEAEAAEVKAFLNA